VRLHSTDIITCYPLGHVRLDTGGWNTVTTRERMNGFLSAHVGQVGNRRRYSLYTVKGTLTLAQAGAGESYWGAGSRVAQFSRTLTIGPRGGITSDASSGLESEQAQLRKRVRAYAAECVAAFPLDMPNAGDCMYCRLFARSEAQGKLSTFGAADHFLSHLEETYVVPSLVWNALTWAGAGQVYFAAAFQAGEAGDRCRRIVGAKHLERFVSRFVNTSLGLSA